MKKAQFRVLARFYAERDQFSECFVISSDNIQEDQRYEIGKHVYVSEDKGCPLYDLINEACGKLPEGWYLNIVMENGCASLEAIDPLGEWVQLPDSTDRTLAQQVKDAIEHICPE